MSNRKLYIIDEINDDMYSQFTLQLDELMSQSRTKPIELEIKSEGGMPYVALAIYGRIRTCPAPVHGTVYGTALSAATVIIAGCDVRRAHEDAWFMFHDSEEKFKGRTHELRKKVQQAEAEELQWAGIIAQTTGTAIDVWLDASKQGRYLTAYEAKQYNLITEILKGKTRES